MFSIIIDACIDLYVHHGADGNIDSGDVAEVCHEMID